MCGLFGWVGTFTRRERRKLARVLAAANDVRGGHSWGFVGSSVDGWERTRGFGNIKRSVRRVARPRFVMAHTRYATTGAVTINNCHPFERENIYLAHNGMVFDDYLLKHESCQVDSELIANRVDVGKDLEDLSGYGVITWARKDDQSRVYLCNLESGDLAVAKAYDGYGNVRGVVWSSSGNALEHALASAEIHGRQYSVTEHQVYIARHDGLFVADYQLELSWYGSGGSSVSCYGGGWRIDPYNECGEPRLSSGVKLEHEWHKCLDETWRPTGAEYDWHGLTFTAGLEEKEWREYEKQWEAYG